MSIFTSLFSCLLGKKKKEEADVVEAAPTTVVVVKNTNTRAAPGSEKPTTNLGATKKTQQAWIQEYVADQNAAKANDSVPSKGVRFTENEPETKPISSSKSSADSRATAMDRLVNRSRVDAESTFARYDKDRDGYLSREDLFDGLKELDLGLTPEMYRQYIDCNFMYADMDGDSMLSFEEYLIIHGMINEVKRKFTRFDKDQDGLINKTDFTKIVKELHLNLDEDMCRSYVDMNFRFVDRSFRGTISFGQFLACYANFLISHSLMHNKVGLDSRPNTAQAPVEAVGAGSVDDTIIVEDIIDDDEIDDPFFHRNGPLK